MLKIYECFRDYQWIPNPVDSSRSNPAASIDTVSQLTLLRNRLKFDITISLSRDDKLWQVASAFSWTSRDNYCYYGYFLFFHTSRTVGGLFKCDLGIMRENGFTRS